MTVTYIGNDLYDVMLSHPEHPVQQSFVITKEQSIQLIKEISKKDDDFDLLDDVVASFMSGGQDDICTA